MDTKRIGYIICESGIVVDAPEMKIIREDTVDVPDQVTGEKTTHRRLVAEAVLQTADLWNRNKRMYPKEELFPQLESPRTKELLAHKRMCGEAGHPLEPSLVRQQTIDPKLVMVRYLKFWTDGDFVWAQYKGTNNMYGDELDMDLREGVIPEFSLRALGSVESTAKGNIVRNMKMITYDVVYYQSDPNAYHRNMVISEAASLGNSMVAETAKNDIFVPIDRKDVIDYIMQESTNIKAVKESFDINRDSIKYLPDIDKVRMMDTNGNTLMINLESYVSNSLMDYAMNRR